MHSIQVFLLCFLSYVWGDTYMHHPRGSNNRLNERSANRDNDARCFNSQNNNRGGYNVGDKSDDPFNTNAPFASPATTFNVDDNSDIQYQLMYFEESILPVEWTAQHGCGGNEKSDTNRQNCNMVLQYMCDVDDASLPVDMNAVMKVNLRDGGNTGTPDEPNSYSDIQSTASNNRANQRVSQESEANYFYCKSRMRNGGLFHADQRLQGDTSIYTRQNPNGDRNGLECPEERDYYPYWAPSSWRDIAYLTDHVELCPLVANGTQNTNTVYYCSGWNSQNFKPKVNGWWGGLRIPINATECVDYGGTWRNYTKKFVPAPECKQAAWSRENHLGNGRESQPLTYNWSLPTYDELISSGVQETAPGFIKCVLRLRYNISTDDYDPWNISSARDNNPGAGIISPVTQNPTINIGGMTLQGLKLAINTAQFGRTFQDRSHIFYIVKRGTYLADKKVWNLGVRGKRGNIVQTYPAVEYDFVSNLLPVKAGDYIHVQWTGSNTHNNGEPAGDGQAGDAGEGTTGTDRTNFCWHHNSSDNFPMPLDRPNPFSLYQFECFRPLPANTSNPIPWQDCAVILATAGQYESIATIGSNFDPLLNDAPASLVQGILLRVNSTAVGKTFNYMCTRNNNFSNRSQKGQIIVVA